MASNRGLLEISATRGRNITYYSNLKSPNGAEARSGWTKIQETYENVHPNLVLVLLFVPPTWNAGKVS